MTKGNKTEEIVNNSLVRQNISSSSSIMIMWASNLAKKAIKGE
jgi:hypothetical protein